MFYTNKGIDVLSW